jgi:hypothetical protein
MKIIMGLDGTNEGRLFAKILISDHLLKKILRPVPHQTVGKEQSLLPTKAESDGHYHDWQC